MGIKDGSKKRKITLTIEKTTLEDKLKFLGFVVIVAFVITYFLDRVIKVEVL
jgi:hypothetical protein